MGKDLYRPSIPEELQKMQALLARELTAGVYGLSTDLRKEEARFATLAHAPGQRTGVR